MVPTPVYNAFQWLLYKTQLRLLFSFAGIYSWNDEIISVALALLEKEVTMGEDTVKKLIEMLRRNALSLCKSSKFAKLIIKLCKTPQYHMMVMSIITKYSTCNLWGRAGLGPYMKFLPVL